MFIINDRYIERDIMAKVISHWILSNLPMVVIAPALSLVLGLDTKTAYVLLITLLIGTPTMSLIGSIAAALTLSLKKNKILMSIIVLPMYIPILIFGTASVRSVVDGQNPTNIIFVLLGFSILTLLVFPKICAKLIKISLE